MEYIQLIGGIILLIFSADYLVKGGVGLAQRFRISPLVIGMTVIAFGTSAPEFIVSLLAAVKGNSEIALGNVIGSNIANIGLILGLTALILPIPVQKASLKYDGPVMLIASLLFIFAAMNGVIGRTEGLIGVSFLVGYTIWMIRTSRKNKSKTEPPAHGIWISILLILLSSGGLAFGAHLLIEGASSLASNFGVSQKVISITIVAFGTSVPELAASLTAALKKQMDISIGNIIGSNLFNILSVIGISSAIHPIVLDFELFRNDFIWMFLFSTLVLLLIYPLRNNIKIWRVKGKASSLLNMDGGKIGRLSGLILVGLYIFYIYLLF